MTKTWLYRVDAHVYIRHIQGVCTNNLNTNFWKIINNYYNIIFILLWRLQHTHQSSLPGPHRQIVYFRFYGGADTKFRCSGRKRKMWYQGFFWGAEFIWIIRQLIQPTVFCKILKFQIVAIPFFGSCMYIFYFWIKIIY